MSEFAVLHDANRIGERPCTDIMLGRPETASLSLRVEGASIRGFSIAGTTILTSPDFQLPPEPSDPDFPEPTYPFVQPVKMDASHTMLPVGPSQEYGPQHGSSRYLTYEIFEATHQRAVLQGFDGLQQLGHRKSFELGPRSLTVIDSVTNLSASAQGISLGEHFYFHAPEASMAGIQFLDKDRPRQPRPVTVILPDGSEQRGMFPTLAPLLSQGMSLLRHVYTPEQYIRLPSGEQIKLEANITHPSGLSFEASGLLIWHRPGTDTICFEPVEGFDIGQKGQIFNQDIELDPGQTTELISQITLL